MPFRFLFGGRRRNDVIEKKAEDELSDASLDEEFSFTEDRINDVYFMNPGFDALSFRAPSASPVPGLTQRQPTRRLSSRAREYKRLHSVDASEFDVDVALAPSAFALQMVPNGMSNRSFCSRDDSEIATRLMVTSPVQSPELSLDRSSVVQSPYVNAMFLHDTFSQDDSEVGSTTMEKIRLRHMGSALSYRLELSGTPEFSVYEDDESCISRPGHSRRYSDMSDRMASFRERNKMIRLESIVGGLQKQDSNVIEFGVLNAEQFANQPTPRLFRSSSEKLLPTTDSPKPPGASNQLPQLPPTVDNQRLESFPISFLDDIVEEDEEESDEEVKGITKEDAVDQTPEDVDRPPSSLSSLTDPDLDPVIQSSFKVRVAPFEVTEQDGFANPAFEAEVQSSIDDSAQSLVKKPIYRMESLKRSKSKARTPRQKSMTPRKDSMKLMSSTHQRKHKRAVEKRDETLHFALLERYLVESYINRSLAE